MQRKASPYFWAMLVAPALAAVIIRMHGMTVPAVLYVFFTFLLLALSAIDCDRLILPDVLTLPGAGLALAATPCLGFSLTESLAGALAGGAGFWLIARAFPRYLGLGDAKLLLFLGALCGLRGLPVVVLAGSASGLTFAFATRRKLVPFGPFLCAGAYLHMLGVRP